MKRIILFFLTTAMLLSSFSAFAATEWPSPSSHGRDMPFSPADKYVSVQNPPAFTWKYVSSALSYDLQIAGDAAFTEVERQYSGITENFFNPPDTFDAGSTYWWRVRYVSSSGVSEWTEGRRFRIDTSAYEFTFPGIDEIMQRIPQSHPRILTTPDTVEAFRSLKDTEGVSKRVYDYYISLANGYVYEYAKGEKGMYSLEEPVFEDTGDDLSYLSKYRTEAMRLTDHMYRTAFAYLLSGEEKYAQLAKKMILSLSTWCMKDDGNGNLVYDPEGHSSYTNQDQVHRYIAYRSAMAYDWLYDTFTEAERKAVLNMIEQRTIQMTYLLDYLKTMPYESHGWTAFGFIGIIGVAAYGEIDGAEDWLRTIIPAYTAMLPPWGNQDGGWSQGTDYWQYSTVDGQEFLDVLVQGGIIDLYKTAWIQNEYLWSLYAYPAGSYGSFGDQSNRNKAGYSSVQSLINEAHYNQNPVAKWLVESFGGTTSNVIDNYYTANLGSLESKAPVDYPLGHEFNDIGWVVMTSDLADKDRIQMTFKSSPYGSFNHSHPDQNAFIIQAYGENLANKSGYYDWYHSTHDNHITRPTFSHNTITVDGGKGQRDDDFTAKGSMEQFVTHIDFDSATGDATDAYKGTDGLSAADYYKGIGDLDKFVRDIIYVRPGVFVVIDDLEAADGGKSSFEWWLNSEHEIEYTNKTALIKENDARLSANVVYPANIKARYYNGFYSPYTDSYYPDTYFPAASSYAGANEQRKVCFYTSKVAKTKIVATMSVYKEDEEAEVISTKYSSDGSCLTLDFTDGTRCVVNLGEDTDTVSDGTVTFTGDAVTYNENSIMLTNGTSLVYNGTELVSSSNRPVTAAMGYNQLTFSVTGDSEYYEENSLVIANNTGLLQAASIEGLKDSKGRVPSPETGLPQSYADEENIYLYPFEGNYSLFAENAIANPEAMKPRNLKIDSISEESFDVVWDEASSVEYDIIINNTIYEGVSSPYRVNISENEQIYDISVRGRYGSLVSEWSDSVYFSPGAEGGYSYVRYTHGTDTLTAEVFAPNPGGQELNFLLVSYGEDGSTASVTPLEDSGGIYSAEVPGAEDCTYRTFLWSAEGIRPLTPAADFSTSGTGLKALLADGEPLEGYENSKDQYTVNIAQGTLYYPTIDAIAENNSTRVTVKNSYAELKTTVEITASDGTRRVITIDYVLENDSIHRVTGAASEEDFTEDTGRSKDINGNAEGKVSNAAVATLTWDLSLNGEITEMTEYLPVYTNLAPPSGDSTYGSRMTSDRDPVNGNFTEFHNPARELWGYDHIVMPNDNFCVMNGTNVGSAVKNAKLTFGLSAPAEVVILTNNSTNADEIMAQQGFEIDGTLPVSTGRYMDVIGTEDIYYNVYLLGKDSDELVSYSLTLGYGSRFRSYSYAADWVDVNYIEGCTTVQDYIDAGYDTGDFTVVGNCGNYVNKHTYYFDMAYVKRFEDIAEPTEITVDFGSFGGNANRMVVVVRPVTPKPPVTDFRYMGPRTFDTMDSVYTEGTTDTYTSKRSYANAYSANPILRTFEDGALAYSDTDSFAIENIDPITGLEGALFVPPMYNVGLGGEDNFWMKAYYCGMRNYEGNTYPGYSEEPMPMYTFKLEKSADLYVVTSGGRPEFLDTTWQRVSLERPAFTVSDNARKYTEMYIKHVDAEEGSPVTVSMKTPSTGSADAGLYFVFVKPTEK